MSKKRFWVIGGEHADMQFTRFKDRPQCFGPFPSRSDAHDEWRRLTAATTHQATTRFRIAAE